MSKTSTYVRVEARRAWCLPINRMTVELSLVVAVIVSLLSADIGRSYGFSWPTQLRIASSLGGAIGIPPLSVWILTIIPLTSWSTEYRGARLLRTLSETPHRLRLYVAKLGLAVLMPIVATILGTLLSVGANYALFEWRGESVTSIAVSGLIIANCGYAAAVSVFAFTVASLIRSPSVAAATVFSVPFVVEPAIRYLLAVVPALGPIESWARYAPFQTLQNHQSRNVVSGFAMFEPTTPWIGHLVLGVLLGSLVVTSMAAFQFRDPVQRR